ncbi:hypothetical protein GCM10010168_34770 [Actinoplanes ianthinogenes]|uniref:Uncharacterized protein n=1 Tax=Actinoplanes ianthinogenes TaxID=122358 RepID=A0ABM7M5S8_9ACTN|nr:hypothetical protein [Actinoplanes ianthinogenes]BCJ47003.1 hypothetical protein Aiant_76600 [Actinoplanes ianthinogenes]GGR14018.1 hypothetical protein GCM10010168_34770 [Actinoplanes ianthinogenes]
MAVLSITMRRPAGGFIYDLTQPKLFIDGIDHQLPSWGQYAFEVPTGPHKVEVYVPYVFPRKAGKAAVEVVIPEQGVAMEYMAPSITFAKGSLGPAGQQKSAGFRAIWAVNAVVIAFVVIVLAVRLFS